MTILLALAVFSTPASAINVKVNADPGINDKAVISRIEHNLSALLTEINSAKDADRPLSYEGLNVSAAAKETLNTLWVVAHFYCCDDEVTDRLWNFRKSYMVRSIPLIIATDGAYGDGTYQEAVVEFDKTGNISDFRFSFGSQLGETLDFYIRQLVENLQTDGALTSDDILIIERMNEGVAMLVLQLQCLLVGIIIDTRYQTDLCTETLGGFHLTNRSTLWQTDKTLHSHGGGTESYTLSMIASRTGYHTLRLFFIGEL